MAYSFQKTSFTVKSRHVGPQIQGAIPSLHNNLLLTSSGAPSIDQLVGCLPVGTIYLIEEDKHQCYSRILLKYFISEGIECGHETYIASADLDTETFVKQLPSAIENKKTQTTNTPSGELKIAWRYENNYEQKPTASKYPLGRNFDTTRAIPNEKLESSTISIFDVLTWHDKSKESSVFDQLFNEIESKLTNGRYMVTSVEDMPSKIFRIAISGIGSPLWPCDSNQVTLMQFLYKLRFLLRSSLAVCLIAVPTYLWKGTAFISRLRHVSDTVIKLESFAASDKEMNPLYKDYHGLIHVEKIPRLNSLACRQREDTRDLAFKLGKKKFVIEKLHLPPLDDEEPRIQNFCTSKPGGNKHIEF